MNYIAISIICLVSFSNLNAQTKQQIADYYYEQIAKPKVKLNQSDIKLTIQTLDSDSLEAWTAKSVRYHNLLVYATRGFRKSEDLRIIWDAKFRNDPYSTCESFRETLDPDGAYFNYPVTAQLMFAHLLREFEYYDSVCTNYMIDQSPELISQVTRIKEYYERNKLNRNFRSELQAKYLPVIEKMIDQEDRYPGRSIVGKDYEDVAWLVIKHSTLAHMKKHLPYVLNAISMKDLDPKYGAYLSDQIDLMESVPQTYGTQTVDGKLYELKYPIEETNKLRKQVGLNGWLKSN